MPYPLDGEESESSEPTQSTEQERPTYGVSLGAHIRHMQEEINRVSHAALNAQEPRVRSSDMAQEVAEAARDAALRAIPNPNHHNYPSMEDALRYATRPIPAARATLGASELADRDARLWREIREQNDAANLRILANQTWPSRSTTTAHRDPPRPEALMHRTDRPVVLGERRGPNSILYSRPFRELLKRALERVQESLDLWGESDVQVSESHFLEELAERRADAAIHKELMQAMKLELEKTQAQLSQAVVVMNNLTIEAVLREVNLTETQRQQIEGMKYEP